MLKKEDTMYERERTVDVLKRLKSQESKPVPESYQKTVKKEEPVKIINLPQRNIENLITKIEELRRKMKTGSQSYFSLYYDLKNAEQLFLKEVNLIKEKNFQIPETTMMRINNIINGINKGGIK